MKIIDFNLTLSSFFSLIQAKIVEKEFQQN